MLEIIEEANILLNRRKEMKRLIIMGIPHHGNLGDNAIAVAEENIIDTYFGDYEKYIVPEEHMKKCVKRVEKYINKDDVLLLHGGGNIGDTYLYVEEARREVIKTFPENKIIIFPQTCYFSDTSKGNEQLEISKNIYNAHKKLVILAREKKSYDFMSKHFYNAKVYLTPDIVMTLEKIEKKDRKGVLFLLRNDLEKTLTNEKLEEVKINLKAKYNAHKYSDMHVGDINLWGLRRKNILDEKFHELQTAELVITDRLHGMIFAAITQTPCIAFSNFNHKIKESYSWLQHLNYIKFCDDVGEIEELIASVEDNKNIEYNRCFAIDKITQVLKEEIN